MREMERDGQVIRYLNVKEAAATAGIPYDTVYGYVKRGLLPAFQLGGKRGPYSIKESDLLEFLNTGAVKGSEEEQE